MRIAPNDVALNPSLKQHPKIVRALAAYHEITRRNHKELARAVREVNVEGGRIVRDYWRQRESAFARAEARSRAASTRPDPILLVRPAARTRRSTRRRSTRRAGPDDPEPELLPLHVAERGGRP